MIACGRDELEGGIPEGQEELLQFDGYVHYLDGGDDLPNYTI